MRLLNKIEQKIKMIAHNIALNKTKPLQSQRESKFTADQSEIQRDITDDIMELKELLNHHVNLPSDLTPIKHPFGLQANTPMSKFKFTPSSPTVSKSARSQPTPSPSKGMYDNLLANSLAMTPSHNIRKHQTLLETAGTGTPNFDSPIFDSTPIQNGKFTLYDSETDEHDRQSPSFEEGKNSPDFDLLLNVVV
jgi:hypothetical protein